MIGPVCTNPVTKEYECDTGVKLEFWTSKEEVKEIKLLEQRGW